MFKDHFSGHAHQYSHARPTYPDELFRYLASLVKEHDLAWDCATGNGQAAVKLAAYFKNVIASDGSQTQLDETTPQKNIEYRLALAEESGLQAHSVDLITVAQAVHWFDFDAFYAEAKRVLKPKGIIAVWCYTLFYTDRPEFNALLNTFYKGITQPFWPPERKYLDDNYAFLPFPFKEVKNISTFSIVNHWSIQQMIEYLQTWSGVKGYEKEKKENPVNNWFIPRLNAIIPDRETVLKMTFPLVLKVGCERI